MIPEGKPSCLFLVLQWSPETLEDTQNDVQDDVDVDDRVGGIISNREKNPHEEAKGTSQGESGMPMSLIVLLMMTDDRLYHLAF